MDIAKQFDAVIEKFGHSIIYLRKDLKFRCECYVERSGEPNPTCDICMGTGYDIHVERFKVRRNVASIPETLIGIASLTQRGVQFPKAYVYYVSAFNEPKDGDYILEIKWDENMKPLEITQRNLISAAEPKQGVEGQIAFYQVYCRYEEKRDKDEATLSKHST